ncbi:hypothetical protein [Halalkalibacter okhensis]|uniref:hypothetical protein n=1 Tax=Halalkalibacter okhensis TaxID=333138 RepID=UPI000B13DE13|nr:hypothetical protein [Halalkalibacter okhensis]
MKETNNATSTFWHGASDTPVAKKANVAPSENEEYEALKKAIREEALKRWGNHTNL